MGSQLTKPSGGQEEHPSRFVRSNEDRSTDVVARDDTKDDLFDTDDDTYEFPQVEVSTITHKSHSPTASTQIMKSQLTKPSDQEEQPSLFASDTHRSTDAVVKTVKGDSSATNDDESSHGCEGLKDEDDDEVTEDSPYSTPGDDRDPRNPEFWRKQFEAHNAHYYVNSLYAAVKCEELDMWCAQFASLTFDMTQDYDTITKTYDLVDCAVREERSLSMTNMEYWMKLPTKKFEYVAGCRYFSGRNRDEWMDQLPGCSTDLHHRRSVNLAIKAAASCRKDVPSQYQFDY